MEKLRKIELKQAIDTIAEFSDDDLKKVWFSLTDWNEFDMYSRTVSIQTWAELLYSEMSYRGISANVSARKLI